MFTGVRAVCTCGAAFPLPREAFASGMTCPGCGTEHTAEELSTLRPPGAARPTCVAIVWILALLVLAKATHVGWTLGPRHAAAANLVSRDLGVSPSGLQKLLCSGTLLPGCAAGIGIAAMAILARAQLRARGGRIPPTGTPLLLCTLLAVLLPLGSLFSLWMRWTLVHL